MGMNNKEFVGWLVGVALLVVAIVSVINRADGLWRQGRRHGWL
jgi:hypothetical protein